MRGLSKGPFHLSVTNNGKTTKMEVVVEGRNLHLLDLDDETTLTNSIDLIYPDIFEELELEGSPHEYNWYLYHTDGEVSLYETKWDVYNFIKASSKKLRKDFVEVMTERKKLWE